MSELQLAGKVAVITGAGRGIGQAIAVAYAGAGAAVCCVARSAEQLGATVHAIMANGGQAIGVTADVTDYDLIANAFKQAVSAFGGIDIVVVSAGVSVENKLVEESDPRNWVDTINVNLIGAFHTAKAAIPYLRQREAGKMIFIGSGMGHRSGPTRSAYASSKAGLWMLTRILSQELATHNICVNELVPGPVLTAFIAGRQQALDAGTAGGEWFKNPEDVAPMALFLATQPESGPTGQSFSLARREL